MEFCGKQDTEICTKGPNGFHWCTKEEEHDAKCKCACGKDFGDPEESTDETQ